MRDWIIKKLGGYTAEELGDRIAEYLVTNAREESVIKGLQALVPVSAVLPKKMGRPKKITGQIWTYAGSKGKPE